MILNQILEEKRREVALSKQKVPLAFLQDRINGQQTNLRNFKAAISKPTRLNLIAEIKKASPSKGVLIKKFDPVKIAQIYQEAGASALSVLTEEKFFKGKLSFIEEIKKKVDLPVLRKDFILDEYQLYESKAAGADCILLIARIINEDELHTLTDLSKQLGLEYIIEVHSPKDVEKTLKVNAEIIGINNRDLESLAVDLNTTRRLKALIPAGKIIISESGIKSYQDVVDLKKIGINAVLVGEALLQSDNILSKTKELIYGHQD